MTLQEGYQSCEAGHGEGHACSHIKGGNLNAEVPEPWDAGSSGGREGVRADSKRDYSGLRMKNHTIGAKTYADAMFVVYNDPAGSAFFDCAVDPWQTKDLYSTLPAAEQSALAKALDAVKDCKGSDACP